MHLASGNLSTQGFESGFDNGQVGGNSSISATPSATPTVYVYSGLYPTDQPIKGQMWFDMSLLFIALAVLLFLIILKFYGRNNKRFPERYEKSGLDSADKYYSEGEAGFQFRSSQSGKEGTAEKLHTPEDNVNK